MVILAFVKSEGKKAAPKNSDNDQSERAPLLGERIPSLEGSLKEKMVRRVALLANVFMVFSCMLACK